MESPDKAGVAYEGGDTLEELAVDSFHFTALELTNQVPRIDFDGAEFVATKAGLALHVFGDLPCLNIHAELIPLMYSTTPDYWGIHLYGLRQGSARIDRPQQFNVTLSPVPLGTRGVVVIGADRAVRIANPHS